MVAKEFNNLDEKEGCDIDCYLQRGVDDDEAAEETLSLCDLAVNSNGTEDYSWSSDFSKVEQSSSSDQDDFFEFYSEGFTASSVTHLKDNIIFCGKLIPYRENNAVPEQSHPRKSHSFSKARTCSSKAQQQEKNTSYKRAVTQKYEYGKYGNYKYDLSEKKVSTLATPAVKSSRWYVFAFGHGRFPTEMDLRDIKYRQSRRNPATTVFGLDGEMIEKSTEKTSRGKFLWRLLRVLGYKSQQANAVAKASFGSVRHMSTI